MPYDISEMKGKGWLIVQTSGQHQPVLVKVYVVMGYCLAIHCCLQMTPGLEARYDAVVLSGELLLPRKIL